MSRKDWEWRTIKKKMEESYYLQRQDIILSHPSNKPVSKKRKRNSDENNEATADDVEVAAKILMPQIKENWPFLFTSQGMNHHFKILTGVNFHEKFTEFVRNKGSNFVEYLSCQSEALCKLKRRMQKAERTGSGSTTTVALLLMLIKQFGDKETSLVQFVEVSCISI